MKIRTTVGALLDAYAIVHPTLDSKGTASNVYLQANDTSNFLYLYSTNLISETVTKLKVEVEKPGEALINPSKLKNGLAGLGKDTPVSLELVSNQLKISSGKVRFSLAASTDVKEMASRMKAIPATAEQTASVPTDQLAEFTRRSMFCIPNDETGQRANLAVLRMSAASEGGEQATATDGSIIVHASSAKKQGRGMIPESGVLISSQALPSLSALATKKKGQMVSIVIPDGKRKVFFKFADGTHFGVLTPAVQYPNVQPVIEKSAQFYFEIPRAAFNQALIRADSFLKMGAAKKGLELEFTKEALVLRANGDDALSDEVPITYVGAKPEDSTKLGMSSTYLGNIVSNSRSENLMIGFSKVRHQPLIVTDKEGDEDDLINIKYIVMGMQVD